MDKRNINFIKDNTNIGIKCGYIYHIFINISVSNTKNSENPGTCRYVIPIPLKKSNRNCYDFYIFEENTQPGNFMIIPKEEFYNQKYIDINGNVIKKHFSMSSIIKLKEDHWAYKYLNNYELLESIIEKIIFLFN